MRYKNIDTKTLRSIKPNFIKNYALSSGWDREGELPNKYFIYIHRVSRKQLIVPMNVEFDDYAHRVLDALELIAEIEKRQIPSVLNDIFTPNADIVKFRLSGQEYENGTVPLGEGLNLISGSKKSLFVSALQVYFPKRHHQRLRNSDVEEFLNKCRFGQTERGSFVTSFICPLGLSEQLSLLNSQESDANSRETYSTFTRKVTANLVGCISLIKKAIDDDNLDILDSGETPLVSSNFCDALLEMRPSSINSNLEVNVKFSTKDTIPNVETNISLRNDYFPEIEKISNELHPDFESKTHTIFAKVDACMGRPNENGKMEGEVILIFIDEESQTKAKISLPPEDYQKAVEAHRQNKYIKVDGEHRPGSRIGKILNYSDFVLQA